jgi:hypothetical protein
MLIVEWREVGVSQNEYLYTTLHLNNFLAVDPASSDLIVPAPSVNNFTGFTITNVTFNSSASSTYQFIGNTTNVNRQGLLIGQDTVKVSNRQGWEIELKFISVANRKKLRTRWPSDKALAKKISEVE